MLSRSCNIKKFWLLATSKYHGHRLWIVYLCLYKCCGLWSQRQREYFICTECSKNYNLESRVVIEIIEKFFLVKSLENKRKIKIELLINIYYLHMIFITFLKQERDQLPMNIDIMGIFILLALISFFTCV